jgi:hypothetical protein
MRFKQLVPAVLTGAALLGSPTLQGQTPPPQQPSTSVVGADGRMVSLIFLRADAENVTRRIYGALLDREPTASEFDASVAELQRGRLPQQLAAMVETDEFTSRASGMTAPEMLSQVFAGMLDRVPTAGETKTHLPRFQAKQYPAAVLKIVTSESFRKQVAQDRALSAPGPAPQPGAAAEPPTAKPGTPPARPPSTSVPPPAVAVPPPPPVPVVNPPVPPPAVPPVSETTRAPEPARPPLRPAPFPTARNSTVSVPAATRPAISPEWTQILDCQTDVVDLLRSPAAQPVLLRFDAPEISAPTVRGTATDTLDGGRRLSYRCTAGRATYAYLDNKPRRPVPAAGFAVEAVTACHAAVTAALKRDRRGGPVAFETAGMMPTDSVLFVRGTGTESSRPAQPQTFTYQCQWDGTDIRGATFALVAR